ncbi:hypothetical protein BH09PSE1_BH09PSE1_23510 [soil metagenome]
MAAEAKTKPTAVSVADFIAAVPDPARRADVEVACTLLEQATGLEPVMWGPAIIGFGTYHYRYESGREGDAPLVGVSPRKAATVFYVRLGEDRDALLARLGKHKTGSGCVHVNRLADVDTAVLGEMARTSVAILKAQYPA